MVIARNHCVAVAKYISYTVMITVELIMLSSTSNSMPIKLPYFPRASGFNDYFLSRSIPAIIDLLLNETA